MKFCRVFLASIAACVWLTSCGGGGGGGGDASSGGWLTFSPSAVDLTVYQGEPVTFTVKANSSKTIAERIYLGVIDTVGLITPNVGIVANTKTNYTATFGTNPNLPVGTHNSVLQVRICLDDAVTCKLPYPDSPWQVPIHIKVLPATNLTPLSKLDGDRPWSSVNGNNSHNAYFSRPVSPENFTRRWSALSGFYKDSPLIIMSGDLIHLASSKMEAQSEFDGKPRWASLLGSDSYIPGVSEGRIMVLGTNTIGLGCCYPLRLYSAKTGQLQGQSDNLVSGFAPFFTGNSVYLGGRFQGKAELARFDVNSGALVWRA